MLSLYDVYDSFPLATHGYGFKTTAFDKLFDRLSDNYSTTDYRVEKSENQLQISIDMPGVKPSDLEILEEDKAISIQYSLRNQKLSKKFAISKIYDVSSAKAKLENGVLEICIDKAQESKKRNIPIEIVK